MFNFNLLISAILLVCIDFIYLKSMKGYFEKQIIDIQGSPLKINFLGAIICYIFLIMGLNYFIIEPKKTPQDGFLLGLVIYGVVETTNLALFTKWAYLTFIMDTLWGGILFGSTTYIVNSLRRFNFTKM
jgi:uncharacterized membrane protein